MSLLIFHVEKLIYRISGSYVNFIIIIVSERGQYLPAVTMKLSNLLPKSDTKRFIVLVVLELLVIIVAVGLIIAFYPNPIVFNPPKTEQFNVATVVFGGTAGNANNYINLTIQNTGTASFTISTAAKVNGENKPLAAQVTINPGGSAIVTIPKVGWKYYQVCYLELLITPDNTKIMYVANAPGGP